MDRRQGYRPERDRTEEQAEGGELDDAGKEHALGHGFHSVLME